jgi:hypothetical protein
MTTHGPTLPPLIFSGKDAVKIIIRFTPDGPIVTTQEIRARALSSLPLTTSAGGPASALEMRDGAGVTLFRRPFSPPGRVEIPGDHPRWVRLPHGYTEVRVVIVPRYRAAESLVAYSGDAFWLRHSLKAGL